MYTEKQMCVVKYGWSPAGINTTCQENSTSTSMHVGTDSDNVSNNYSWYLLPKREW